MIKNSYSKDEVQLMFEYINKLEQKQKLLEETIKQIVLENNNKLDTINYKINKLEHENIKKDNHIESLEDIIKELAHENNNNFNVLNSKLDKLDKEIFTIEKNKEIITIEKNKEKIEHIIKEHSLTNSQIGFR